MATKPPQLPDIYQLLQLEPLEEDRGKIEAALLRLLSHGRELQAKQPKQAQRLAKVVELGKRHLLNADAKAKYDAHWLQVNQPQLATVATTTTWDMSELESYLPAGDPLQAFDLAAFLSSADSLPTQEYTADFAKLQALLQSGATPSSPDPTHGQPLAHLTANLSPSSAANAIPNAYPPYSVTAPGPATTPQTQVPPARRKVSLAKELRAKRDRSLLKIAAGILLTLATVLGFLFWMMNPGRQAQSERTLAAKPPAPNARNSAAINADGTLQINPQAVERPRGSGLPKVKGLDGNSALDGNLGDLSTDNNSPNEEASAFDIRLTMNDPTEFAADDSSLDSMAEQGMADGDMASEDMTDGDMDIASENMASDDMASNDMASKPMVDEPAPPVSLTSEEKQAWQELLLSLRKQIGEQDYSEAREKLEQAQAQAKTVEQRAQLKRLQTIARLAEEFHAALVSGTTGLGAGETLMVKSTPISIVEGTAEKIVIRNQGRNQTYTLIEIPVGLAYALVDLRMDSAHPSSQARKAAFALVHPKSNDIVTAKAREMMAEAIESEVVDADLMNAFDDDFALP